MTDIDTLGETWDKLGSYNAFWAVLSNKKEWDKEEFFELGRREIQQVLNTVEEYNVSIKYGQAMDFGCGLGRLTQALGEHFEKAIGVDIAASMVKQAKQLNESKNVSFKHVTSGDLAPFKNDSLDFIFTDIVFQHMENTYALSYLREMYKKLKKGGVLVFQIPSQPTNTWKGLLIKALPDGVLTKLRKGMEMHPIDKFHILEHLKSIGYEVITVEHDPNHIHWDAYFYYVRKPSTTS